MLAYYLELVDDLLGESHQLVVVLAGLHVHVGEFQGISHTHLRGRLLSIHHVHRGGRHTLGLFSFVFAELLDNFELILNVFDLLLVIVH